MAGWVCRVVECHSLPPQVVDSISNLFRDVDTSVNLELSERSRTLYVLARLLKEYAHPLTRSPTHAKSSLNDAKSSLGDAQSSLGDV
jgi:hypothetical protein